MEVLGYILMLFIGYFFGWNTYHIRMREQVEDVKPMLPEHINITIEVNDQELFAYDLATKQFMAKGKTRLELETALKTRYPNKSFMVDQDGMNKLDRHPQ